MLRQSNVSAEPGTRRDTEETNSFEDKEAIQMTGRDKSILLTDRKALETLY